MYLWASPCKDSTLGRPYYSDYSYSEEHTNKDGPGSSKGANDKNYSIFRQKKELKYRVAVI